MTPTSTPTSSVHHDADALPCVDLQHDAPTVIQDITQGIGPPSEDIWVSCYHHGNTAVHGKIRVDLENRTIKMKGRGGVNVQVIDSVRDIDVPPLTSLICHYSADNNSNRLPRPPYQ